MVKDGEHDKIQMVNKCTFNNIQINNNNYNNDDDGNDDDVHDDDDDDDDDNVNNITFDLPMSLYSFSIEI